MLAKLREILKTRQMHTLKVLQYDDMDRPILSASSNGVAERSRAVPRCSAKSRCRSEIPATRPCLFLPHLNPPSICSEGTLTPQIRYCERPFPNLPKQLTQAHTGDTHLPEASATRLAWGLQRPSDTHLPRETRRINSAPRGRSFSVPYLTRQGCQTPAFRKRRPPAICVRNGRRPWICAERTSHG